MEHLAEGQKNLHSANEYLTEKQTAEASTGLNLSL